MIMALLTSLTGLQAINSLKALHEVMPNELQDKEIHRCALNPFLLGQMQYGTARLNRSQGSASLAS